MAAAVTTGAAAAVRGTVSELTGDLVKSFLSFVNKSPSPFHAVASATDILNSAGFEQLREDRESDWRGLKPNGKYYFTRNQSTVFAFALGGKYKPGNGFNIAAAHTDSPVLRVKPVSQKTASGFLEVGVETYGGGLWHTWFDRDLTVAGRVIVANKDSSKFESRLVHVDKPILRIPMLAIHLNRDIYTEGFKPNPQSHVLPILATVKAQLDAKAKTAAETPAVGGGKAEEEKSEPVGQAKKHHSLLLQLLADALHTDVPSIRDFELSLADTQPAVVGGALDEFIFSPRLDNLMMSFLCVASLVKSCENHAGLADDTNARLIALFDHEEIGSNSSHGAASNMMESVLTRINGNVDVAAALRKSFCLSCDMAHAVHPNYSDKHEENHRPELHKGLVLKYNSSQRYATNSVTAFFINELAARHKIPVQEFCVRNDTGCGSTIGPILATNCGMRTVDVGVPQLSMHSIREMCSTTDVTLAFNLLEVFWNEFTALDNSLTVDGK